ncbi:LrgB family protein [Natronospora cellulosivora (SeqCode)]
MIIEFAQEPVFGITLTIGAYFLGCFLYKKKKIAIFHPILVSLFIIFSCLIVFDISFDSYNNGGRYISILLGPATVALAIPMYKKLELLKENLIVILLSILLSSFIAILMVVGLGIILNTDNLLLLSLIPKSVTTPIAVEISEQIGGIMALTAAAVIVTGLLGGMFGPELNRLFKVKSTIAKGMTMGITAHGLGTARALEESEQEGALGGLAICVMGFFTAINAPILLLVLEYFGFI